MLFYCCINISSWQHVLYRLGAAFTYKHGLIPFSMSLSLPLFLHLSHFAEKGEIRFLGDKSNTDAGAGGGKKLPDPDLLSLSLFRPFLNLGMRSLNK